MKKINIKSILAMLYACAIFCSCKTLHTIEQLPEDNYYISTTDYTKIDSISSHSSNSRDKIKVAVVQEQDDLLLQSLQNNSAPIRVVIENNEYIKLSRIVTDFDVITIPFKIRPTVKGFPAQMNATFNGALYLGKRKDTYAIKKSNSKIRLKGVGYGMGAFFGVGSVTMNPFVLQETVNYEYDGFVIQGGFAGIYDAKRFNFGLAIGADLLMDKNRKNWIYQGKPWIGMLFGIQLN